MKNNIIKIKSYFLSHKKISLIILVVLILISYFVYTKIKSNTNEIQYVTTTVQKGTIVSSVTASGQIESSSEIDLRADVTGNITYISVKSGDKIKKGQTLFVIDKKNAEKNIRDAEISLKNAKISLEKLKNQNSNENMNSDLEKTYDNSFSTISAISPDLQSIINDIDTILNKNDISDNVARASENTAQNYRNEAVKSYYDAKKAYKQSNNDLISLNYDSKKTDIDNVIEETYNTTKSVAKALKDLNNYINYLVEDTGETSNFTSYKETISGHTTKNNGYLSNIISIKDNIKSSRDAFTSSDLDIQSSLLAVEQKEIALQDAKDALLDYFVRAPFDGTISSVVAKIGDTSSQTLGTVITNQKIATLSMNEVDVSKIKLGQKATITFDAISDLTMTGSVVEIDTVGTTSQGVVSYSVKIAFDTDNEKVKPGMSVSASIITDSKTDVLYVPSGAVKTKGSTKYIQMFDTPLGAPQNGEKGTTSKETPKQITIETGISDDTNTEIISGLKEGDQIVSNTIINSINNTTKNNSNQKGFMGGARF